MNDLEASFGKQWLGCTNMIYLGLYNAQDMMLALLLNPFAELLEYHCMIEFADKRGET